MSLRPLVSCTHTPLFGSFLHRPVQVSLKAALPRRKRPEMPTSEGPSLPSLDSVGRADAKYSDTLFLLCDVRQVSEKRNRRQVLRLSSHESAPLYFHVRIFKLERSGLRQTQAETQNVTAPGVSDTRETLVLSMFICGLATRVQARGQTDCKPARSPLRHAN